MPNATGSKASTTASATTGASVGVALWPEDSGSNSELLKHADVATYRAKAAGGNRFEMFKPMMSVADHDRIRVESDLHRAIADGEFFLRFHPQVDLRTDQVVAVEALLRWQHPTRGEIDPAQFIPVAEEPGSSSRSGKWVIEEACRQVAGNLGHALGLEVLAEGVETEAQRRALVSFGCEQAQGYLWAQPLRADELESWLTARAPIEDRRPVALGSNVHSPRPAAG